MNNPVKLSHTDVERAIDAQQQGLIAEYEAWLKMHELNLGSADEHLADGDLTDGQRAWLAFYCRRWDANAELAREFKAGNIGESTMEGSPLPNQANPDLANIDINAIAGNCDHCDRETLELLVSVDQKVICMVSIHGVNADTIEPWVQKSLGVFMELKELLAAKGALDDQPDMRSPHHVH
ncbi:MAG TPA: hypothetical protein VF077_08960 [Nitrospiraceae bacterium]